MRIGGFKGVDNVHRDSELPLDTLRRGVNVDVLDSGNIKRRKGHSLVAPMANAHSLWADNAGNGYLVQGGAIKRVLQDGQTEVLGAIADTGWRVSYVEIGGMVFFSSKTQKGRIKNNKLEPWGVETPSSAPTVGLTAGSLFAGDYYLAVSYVLADGRESGLSAHVKVEVDDVGGVSILSMPMPASALVTKKRIYMTQANSEVMYFVREVAPTAQFATISSHAAGQEARHSYMREPPFSNCLMEVNGRIFGIDAANPKVVWHSNALDYDHVDSRKNYYSFTSPVTQIASTRTGLYVAAGKTYFIAGAGTEEAQMTEVFDYGAIANTAQLIKETHEYIWMTERGAVIGHEGGQAELLSANSFVAGGVNNAAAMVRESDGLRQYVAVGQKAGDESLASASYFEAEVIRREDL